MKRAKNQAGFSTLEMLVVVAMSVVITAIAVPSFLSTSQFFRIAGDLRAINAVTAQAKIRAAADFTHARVYADLTHGAFQLQVWYKTGGASNTGCWVSDADPGLLNNNNNPTCITWSNAPAPSGVGITQLAQGDTFGFGSQTSGPGPGQAAISQGTATEQCYQEGTGATAGKPDGGSQMANTACIEFNSRGIPVKSNNPVPTGAFYVTNGKVVDAVTVSGTGSIQTWSLSYGQTTWQAQ